VTIAPAAGAIRSPPIDIIVAGHRQGKIRHGRANDPAIVAAQADDK
jgi:hypothetical protein